MNWRDYIEQRPDVMMGKPVFKGTRLTVEFILERQAAAEVRMEEYQRKTEEEMREIRIILKEVLIVQKAQGHILLRLEKGLDRLEKAQEVTEKKFQNLMDSLRRGRNGHSKL